MGDEGEDLGCEVFSPKTGHEVCRTSQSQRGSTQSTESRRGHSQTMTEYNDCGRDGHTGVSVSGEREGQPDGDAPRTAR